MIPGAGGNSTVFVTQSGIVLVDTKLANNGEAILSQVRTVSGRAVTMIINTHSHPDHIGSNDYFPASVEKVTHENTKKWMEANPRGIQPCGDAHQDVHRQTDARKWQDRIDLYYFGAGHTNGDAFVVFPALAMAAGDIFAWKMAPSSTRWPAAAWSRCPTRSRRRSRELPTSTP